MLFLCVSWVRGLNHAWRYGELTRIFVIYEGEFCKSGGIGHMGRDESS